MITIVNSKTVKFIHNKPLHLLCVSCFYALYVLSCVKTAPVMAMQGNNQGRTQVQYNARYPMPALKSGSSNNLY